MKYRFTRVLPRTAFAVACALTITACADTVSTRVTAPDGSARLLSASGNVVLVGFKSTPGDAGAALIQSLGGTVVYQYKYIPVIAARIPSAQETVLAGDPRVAYVEQDIPLYPLGSRQIVDWGVTKVNAPGAWDLGARGQGVKVGIFDSGIDIDHPDLTVVGGIDLVGDGNGLDDCDGHGTHVAGIVGASANGHHTVGVAPKAQLYSMRLADCNWGGGTLAKMIQGLEWAVDNGIRVVNMSFGFGLGTSATGSLVSSPLPPETPPSRAAEDAFAMTFARGVVLIAASGNSSTPYVGYPAAYSSVIAVGATDDADLLASFSQSGVDQELTAPGVANLASYMVGKGQSTTLTVPSDGGREIDAVPLTFSGMTGTRGITSAAVYAGLGSAADFATVNCVGATAVVMRGGPTFAQKAEAAMNAGCAALIIHNLHPGGFAGTLGADTASGARPWIPVVSVSLEDGLYLKEKIEAGPTTTTLINAFGNLAVLSGTSMASPHAAGVAALILSKNPSLTSAQVRSILRSSSVDLGTPGWDPVFGYGRVDARRAVQQTP